MRFKDTPSSRTEERIQRYGYLCRSDSGKMKELLLLKAFVFTINHEARKAESGSGQKANIGGIEDSTEGAVILET